MHAIYASDTHPDAQCALIEMACEAPAWRKAYIAGRMYETVKYLALVGLRRRYPGADEPELRRRLADLLLGLELAARVYGPLPAEEPWHAP
jgi:hypothetical protein